MSSAKQAESVILYCRAGFEGECAAEITERAAALGVAGYCKTKPESAYVVFVPAEEAGARMLTGHLSFDALIFARQMFMSPGLIKDLPVNDRVTPLLRAWENINHKVCDIFIETADTNEAKELLGFCRKFSRPLVESMQKSGWIDSESAVRGHMFFLSSAAAYPGIIENKNSSPWHMGIPRLKFPRGAPSRSTLKLEEALHVFLAPQEREQRLCSGMRAVDLGAAPGGWSWQFIQRNIHVTAVDNGPLAPQVLDSGLVEHLRADCFRYAPRHPVDWMVCDVVEQPRRIAGLVARWLSEGWCRQTIFNLKLPMKKRYEEVKHCRQIIGDALASSGLSYVIRFKQLYHDREEVTGYIMLMK